MKMEMEVRMGIDVWTIKADEDGEENEEGYEDGNGSECGCE
jgi:hypothetical protein